MVAEYLECSANTEYDMVQLFEDLDLKRTYQPIDHGSMTAVIRYINPQLINNTYPLIIFSITQRPWYSLSFSDGYCYRFSQMPTCLFGNQSSVYVAA